MNYSTAISDVEIPGVNYNSIKSIVINTESKLYKLLLSYIASHLIETTDGATQSFEVSINSAKPKIEGKPEDNSRVLIEIGLGSFKFKSLSNDTLFAIHQTIGAPVGTYRDAQIYRNLILQTTSKVTVMTKFLGDLLDMHDKNEAGTFQCFNWSICSEYWRKQATISARPMDSVVLPSSTKSRLIKDLERFLSPSTENFYNRNGIPYRRSYLFYGLPGTGKTSMIQALAGHFKRSVSYLMPTHPKMTDDSLKEAINSLPSETIVVFEDIDSLFNKDRSNKITSSALTFSGLLNALDGIGNPKGQIFVLTTNLRDQLDQALIRNGRVDLHIEFTYADSEQMETMWCNFYPDAAHLAKAFSDKLQMLLQTEGLHITTANLQHFFITQMDHSAQEALDDVLSIVDEAKLNSIEHVKVKASQNLQQGDVGSVCHDEAGEVKSDPTVQ